MMLNCIVQRLVEKICELDDELMMMYLEDEIPSVDQLKGSSS